MLQTNQNVFFALILLLIIACFSGYYAYQKGRNPVIWFILGILIGLFAPLILFVLSLRESSKFSNEDLKDKTGKEEGFPGSSLHLQPSLVDLKHPEEEDKLWYYLDLNHQQMGPISVIGLRELWNTGRLELISYVWTEGMAQWERVDNLPRLKEILSRANEPLA